MQLHIQRTILQENQRLLLVGMRDLLKYASSNVQITKGVVIKMIGGIQGTLNSDMIPLTKSGAIDLARVRKV